MEKKQKTATYQDGVVELAMVQPHPRNPRIHPEPGTPGWNKLVKSLDYDYYDPLVYNERNNCWVSGHLRAKMLMAQGVTHAKVVVVDYPEDIHIARMISANKQVGEWDMSTLKDAFIDIDTGDLDLDLTGFDMEEIENLLVGAVIKEHKEQLRPKEYLRILISIPVDQAIEIKPQVEEIAKTDGVEVLYGSN